MLHIVSESSACVFVQRKEAFIKHQFLLEEIKHEELQKPQASEAQQRLEAELKLHRV